MRGCEGLMGTLAGNRCVTRPPREPGEERARDGGALTVLELLHAADRCRVAAEPERHLDEGLLMGCFWLAGGWLSGLVGRLGRSDSQLHEHMP
jgi:hypothetical protein